MRRFFTGLSVILLILAGAIFALYNPQLVQFHYILGSLEMPLAILLVACLALGVFLGWLTGSWQRLRLRYHIRELRQTNKQVSSELSKIQRS